LRRLLEIFRFRVIDAFILNTTWLGTGIGGGVGMACKNKHVISSHTYANCAQVFSLCVNFQNQVLFVHIVKYDFFDGVTCIDFNDVFWILT